MLLLHAVPMVIKTGLMAWRAAEITARFSSLARKLQGSNCLAETSFSETQRHTAFTFVPLNGVRRPETQICAVTYLSCDVNYDGNEQGLSIWKESLSSCIPFRKLEGRIEMTGRRGRRRKQLLDDLKEKKRYWKLREEALDRTLWRTRFGRGYGPVVRQTTEWMNGLNLQFNLCL
jgi:hypothetical protein